MEKHRAMEKEIETCGKTRYRIAQDTSVSEAQLNRFLVRNGSLKTEPVGTLLGYFGYDLLKNKATRKI